MIISIIILIIVIILFVNDTDVFVDGASSIVINFKVSKLLIGLTIVAFGARAPEFAVSIQSHLNGVGDLLVDNVIESNICMVLGIPISIFGSVNASGFTYF